MEYEYSSFNNVSLESFSPTVILNFPIRKLLYSYSVLWLHGNFLPPSSGFKRHQFGP